MSSSPSSPFGPLVQSRPGPGELGSPCAALSWRDPGFGPAGHLAEGATRIHCPGREAPPPARPSEQTATLLARAAGGNLIQMLSMPCGCTLKRLCPPQVSIRTTPPESHTDLPLWSSCSLLCPPLGMSEMDLCAHSGSQTCSQKFAKMSGTPGTRKLDRA